MPGKDVMPDTIRQELMERARDLGVQGRSRTSKEELAAAIARRQ